MRICRITAYAAMRRAASDRTPSKIGIQPPISVTVRPAMNGTAMATRPAIMISTLSTIDHVSRGGHQPSVMTIATINGGFGAEVDGRREYERYLQKLTDDLGQPVLGGRRGRFIAPP